MADGHVTCLRSVLMKPEHEAWLERIWNEIGRSVCAEVGLRIKMAEIEASVAGVEAGIENVLIRAGECAVMLLPQFGGKIASIRIGKRELLQPPLGADCAADADDGV